MLAVGISYKPDVSDDRESASVRVARLLQSRGADVFVLDPHVSDDRIMSHGLAPADADGLSVGYDLAVILTDHSDLPYERIAASSTAVFDTRGIYRRLGLSPVNLEVL